MATFVPQPSFASMDLHHPSPQSKYGNHLLQQHTLLGTLFRDWIQHCLHSFRKHLPDTILQESRTLHVFNSPNLLGQGVALLLGSRSQALLLQLLHCFCIAPQVPLGAHQQDGHVGAVMRHLGVPLVPNIGMGGGAANRKADDENIGLGIGERAQAVILLLACCVPQVEADSAAVYAHLGAVVVEHCGNVLFGEGIGGIRDE